MISYIHFLTLLASASAFTSTTRIDHSMTTHHITFHSRNTPFTTIFKTSLIPTTTSTIIRNNNNSQLPRTKDVSLALEANQIFAISLYGLGVMATVKMHGVDETKDVSSPSISSPVSSEGELEVTPEDSDEVEVLSDDDDDDTVEPEGLDVDISITSEEVAYEEVSSTEEVEVEPEDSDDVGVLNDEDDEEEESTSSPTSIFDEASRQLDKTFQEMTKISDLKKSVSSTVEGELEKIDRLKSTEDEELKESESSVAVIEEEEEFEEVDPTKKTRIIVKIIKKAIRPWKKWSTL